MKKIFFLVGIFALLCTLTPKAQVTIGQLTPPDPSAELQVISPDSTRGVLIPDMSAGKRDLIANPADGLVIYNTDENCFNYYNASSSNWISLCGGIAVAKFTIDNCSDITVKGTYVQSTALNSNNYLSIVVNVAKEGTYSIQGTTSNGYGFSSQGTFVIPGQQIVTVSGQGMPENLSDGDILTLKLNGTPIPDCDPPITIPVGPAGPTYSIDCSSVMVNGVYSKGVALKPTNTITLSVDIGTQGNGQYNISTNEVNGISFSGSGIFTGTGKQTVSLMGTGTPTVTKPITLTISTNSAGLNPATCKATVTLLPPATSILVLGGPNTAGNLTYGYCVNSSASYAMMMNTANFGATTSTVPMAGPVRISGMNASGPLSMPGDITSCATGAQLQPVLSGATPPDIVVIGWNYTYDAGAISALVNYLNNGGVVVIFNKFASVAGNAAIGDAAFFSQLYGTNVTATALTNSTGTPLALGSSYGSTMPMFPIVGDPIENGPFNKGMVLSQWGNDYFPAEVLNGIPSDKIITYTGANNAAVAGAGLPGVTMFRDKTLNLFYCGDGGFLSNAGGANTWSGGGTYSNNICPFRVTSTTVATPIPGTGWGSAATYGGTGQTIYNSQIFGNVMAWAITQACVNGINVK